jgi:hypothetical protein
MSGAAIRQLKKQRPLLTSSHEAQDAIADRARQVDLEEPLPLLRTCRLVLANPIKTVWLGLRCRFGFSRREERDSKGNEEKGNSHNSQESSPDPFQRSWHGRHAPVG